MTSVKFKNLSVDKCLSIVRYIETQGLKRNVDFTWFYIPSKDTFTVDQSHYTGKTENELIISFNQDTPVITLLQLKYQNENR